MKDSDPSGTCMNEAYFTLTRKDGPLNPELRYHHRRCRPLLLALQLAIATTRRWPVAPISPCDCWMNAAKP